MNKREIAVGIILAIIFIAILSIGLAVPTQYSLAKTVDTNETITESDMAPYESETAPTESDFTDETESETIIEDEPMTETETEPVVEPEIITFKPTAVTYNNDTLRVRANVPLDASLQQYINGLCAKHNIPQALIYAIIRKESVFNAEAVHFNSDGTVDVGLCQINSSNHKHYENLLGSSNKVRIVSNGATTVEVNEIWFNPKFNVEIAIRMIAGHYNAHYYTKQYKNLPHITDYSFYGTDALTFTAEEMDISMALMCYECGAKGAERLWTQSVQGYKTLWKNRHFYDKYIGSGLGQYMTDSSFNGVIYMRQYL